ncbi:flagellar hook assembly protein FlgD [Sphingomonas oryzagri]|jgi:flagellar basal-body rod modification protein FlgD|uniref:Basal-body rod modification protein FlgD n=1 Tax=Sphingomonas oryzagri TaxID=3042314 RepID=A0ABT6N4S3_9SPHN|nr:flagellar hook capping FlgD N-terminal domain-containing protein [Sphingomonas oryzagri]MDH7639636.1 flagellar hook capping FlgD N-terminal domain-containing protein [Sphingomonas oryzagri]
MTTTTDTSNSYLSSLYGTSSSSSSSSTATTGSDTIDQAGFLKLLTAQMTMQDPTAPMDSNTMVQQMSQMSEVQGITEMNTSLQSLASEMEGNRIGDAASWIGKAALLSSSTAQPLTNGGYAGEITLPSAASNMNVSLVDSTGKTVYTQTLTNQAAGTVDFAWDGKLSDGTQASGPLTVKVSASGTSGTINPTVSTWATITGVNSPAGGSSAQLTTTLGTVAPTDVLSLS